MTDQQWGRRDDAGRWMRSLRAGALSAVLLAAATFYVACQYRVHKLWTPAQRAYLSMYVRSTAAASFGLKPKPYDLPNAPRPGALYDNAEVVQFLRTAVYGGQSLFDLARAPLLAAGVVLALGLVFGIPHDAARKRARRHGRLLKGPQKVSAEGFNRIGGDGLAIRQEDWPLVRIPKAKEAEHVLITGDTGTGKSLLIRQFLCQIRDRGETAVVYDPAREYLPEFLDQDRGDLILNPIDARCAYWTPGDEVRSDPEALTLATALFPNRPNENRFFTEGPRLIFAYLLTIRPRPTAADLARWLASGAELDRLLAGTRYAHFIDPNAPAQRSGVLSSLNIPAEALAMLPGPEESTGRWSATEWAKTRRGWLFFTSGPATRERQIPLMTLWLDLLILRLMEGASRGRKTWIIIDELANLRHLPQLQAALTESRKVNTSLVIAFQAKSQMEALYGHAADAILSQPATKIFLRTNEANGAKWVSDTIGQVETERLRESRDAQGRPTFNLSREVEPLLLPSEIAGLKDRTGYLKSGNVVTPLRIPILRLPTLAPDIIERPETTVIGFTPPLPPGYVVVPPDHPGADAFLRSRGVNPTSPPPASHYID